MVVMRMVHHAIGVRCLLMSLMISIKVNLANPIRIHPDMKGLDTNEARITLWSSGCWGILVYGYVRFPVIWVVALKIVCNLMLLFSHKLSFFNAVFEVLTYSVCVVLCGIVRFFARNMQDCA